METLEIKRCINCDSELDPYHVTFCSKDCFNEYHRRLKESEPIKYCKNCNRVLFKTKTFCNRKCQHEYAQLYADIHWHGVTLTDSRSENKTSIGGVRTYVQ